MKCSWVISSSPAPPSFTLDDDVIGPSSARMMGSVGHCGVEFRRSESPTPYPLPMPAYGGYFAPLNVCLPENLPPTPGFHRSDLNIKEFQ